MSCIQAVIFDIGGVLVRIQDPAPSRAWERRLGLSEGQLGEIVCTNPVAQQALVGNATTDQMWTYIGRHLALPPDELVALRADFWRVQAWDTELLAFVRSLRPRCKTATISDAWPDAREILWEYANDDNFDGCVFSAEEGVRKPDPEIYRRALSRLDVAPQEAVFCDDRRPNVKGARRIGMHAFQFSDPDQAREEITRLLRLQGTSFAEV
jgi:putative hydrolase of the HAD superfamily